VLRTDHRHDVGFQEGQKLSASEDLTIVQSAYEAFGRGDIPAVLETFAPDIQWHFLGRNALAGTYKGPQEVVGFFTQLMEGTGGTFSMEIDDFLASDQHVVVLVRASAHRDGKRLQKNGVHIWQLMDGKVIEVSDVALDPYAQDDFWA
jgi:ketosteroid isomerase-like protein